MELKECWMEIEDYEMYEVSDLGNVRSLNYGGRGFVKNLSQSGNIQYYSHINLYKNKKQKCFFVHRLVAKAFVPNPENKPEVNHINEIKGDNRAVNLNWMTACENTNYGTGNDRRSKKVIQLTSDGDLVKEWKSTIEAARNGFDQGAISNCCLKKYGFKTHKKFRWEYI